MGLFQPRRKHYHGFYFMRRGLYVLAGEGQQVSLELRQGSWYLVSSETDRKRWVGVRQKNARPPTKRARLLWTIHRGW